MKTVVVTGAAGFLGSHLAEYYLRKNYTVIGIDNLISSSGENAALLQSQYPQFHFFQQDVCESWQGIESKINGKLEYVFHFASPASPRFYRLYPFETISANTQGLMAALNFAQNRQGRLIFASSSEVYGDPQIHPQNENYWGNANSFGQRSCYHEAKRLAESMIFEFNRLKKSHHGLVRIFNTYGPRMVADDGRVVINFLLQAGRGENLTIYGDGSQTRSFCYVDDLISGITKYAESTLAIPVNLGNPQEISVLNLASLVQKIYPQRKLRYDFDKLPQDDPKMRSPDIYRAQEYLHWSPQVDLWEGLQKTAGWLETSQVTDEMRA